jgi:hypothetical protein
MKRLILATMIGLFTNALNAQSANVPTIVKNAFAKEFPTASKLSWDIENGDFEAEFTLNGIAESATYDKTGHRKEVEVDIKISELPKAVTDYIASHYVGYKLIEGAKITNDKNVLVYEAEVGKDGKKKDVIFDVSGKFLKEEMGD